jgi:hypothetical protein
MLVKWALLQRPLSAPLSVIYGAKDTFIDAQSTPTPSHASARWAGWCSGI